MACDFTDAKGRRWVFGITLGDCETVREAAGVDLETILEDNAKSLTELFSNQSRLAKVAYALLASKDATVDAKEFSRGLDGRSLAGLKKALREALIDFFQSQPDQAETISQILRMHDELSLTMLERVKERFASIKEKASAEVVARLESISFDDLCGKPQAGSA